MRASNRKVRSLAPSVRKMESGAIREPRQARSRESMDRIMESLEALLLEKPFDKITMVELAQHSGTGTSSIYARFKDKSALILGVHMRLREAALSCLSQLTDPARWDGKPLRIIVGSACARAIAFYRDHGALIRAALLVDDVAVRERQASVLRAAAQQFCDLLAPRMPEVERIALNGAIDAACRIFASVMYSELIFGDVQMTRAPVTDITLCRQLTRATLSLLEHAGEIAMANELVEGSA